MRQCRVLRASTVAGTGRARRPIRLRELSSCSAGEDGRAQGVREVTRCFVFYQVSRNWEQPRAAAHSTMLFWLRFFGYKRTPKLAKSYENPAGGGLYIPSSRKSIAYNPSEMHSDDDVAPL